MTFIGPGACRILIRCVTAKKIYPGVGTEAMSAMGDKIRSKQIAKDAGVNIIPGFIGEVDEHDQILKICSWG